MKGKQTSLYYVITYLSLGGAGLAFLPDLTLKLLFSTGDYGSIMPRVVGMFMMGLSYLLFRIVNHQDWKYYLPTIQVRSVIVLFLFWLYAKSSDPMFLVLNGVVLAGLIPSIVIYLKSGVKQ